MPKFDPEKEGEFLKGLERAADRSESTPEVRMKSIAELSALADQHQEEEEKDTDYAGRLQSNLARAEETIEGFKRKTPRKKEEKQNTGLEKESQAVKEKPDSQKSQADKEQNAETPDDKEDGTVSDSETIADGETEEETLLEERDRDRDSIGVDIRSVLLEVLGHWKLILFIGLMMALVFGVYSKFVITPVYKSTASVFVLSKSATSTSLVDLQSSTGLTSDYFAIVKSRPVVEQVIANMQLSEDYQTMLGKIEVTNPTDSRILEISVYDSNPQRARAIAEEVAEVSSAYIAIKMSQNPPSLLHNGYADGAAVSPNITRNTLIGFLLGCVIAIVLVVLIFMMNDTIVSPDDVEVRLSLHVLGTVPYVEERDEDRNRKKRSKHKGR